MWQTSGMGGHAQGNPWMKLMGIVQKERRHHDSGSVALGADRNQYVKNDEIPLKFVKLVNFMVQNFINKL